MVTVCFFLALIPSTHQPIRNDKSYGAMGSLMNFSPRLTLNSITNVGNYFGLNAKMAQWKHEETTNFPILHYAMLSNKTAVGKKGSEPQNYHRVRIASRKDLGAGEAVDTDVVEKEVSAEMHYFLWSRRIRVS